MTKKPKTKAPVTRVETRPVIMTQADRIISLLGGVRPAARITGIPATTISGWRKFGYVPAHRQAAVLKAAVAAGIRLKPSHFFTAESA